MAWRIVTTATMGPHEGAIERLAAAGCVIDRLPADAGGWTPKLIERFARTADAYVGTFRGVGLTRQVLEASPRVRVATSPIIGVEHIDVAAASELGIVVAHGAMAENFEGMAEAGAMLVAALRKRMPQKTASMAAGEWKKGPSGHLVRGSVVGLLGLGRIGQGVARRLAGWGCELIAHDPYVDAGVAARHGVALTGFDDLMARSDVLLVLVTLTRETRHIIDAAAIARMKPGAALINIGRGGCVDETALIAALNAGHLSGAAIDTWEQEPPPEDHPLRRHPQVIATSHDVGHSAELYAAIPETAAANTLAALRGEPPLHVRNPGVLPLWLERVAALGRD
jgi:D-3-phosphoglycerate dehydrogenase / 2-oxoglutarate reductase